MNKIAEKKLWLLESFNAAQILLELAGEKLMLCRSGNEFPKLQ